MKIKRLNISNIGHAGVSHNCCRIGINQHNFIAELAQRLACLRSRIIKFAGLADYDRPGANNQNFFYIIAFSHSLSFHLLSHIYFVIIIDELTRSSKLLLSSFRRKPESSYFRIFWTPAFAGVTIIGLFTRASLFTFFVFGIHGNADAAAHGKLRAYFAPAWFQGGHQIIKDQIGYMLMKNAFVTK